MKRLGPGNGVVEIGFCPGPRDAGQSLLAVRTRHRFRGFARRVEAALRDNCERIAHVRVPIVFGFRQPLDYVRKPRRHPSRNLSQAFARRGFPTGTAGQQSVHGGAGIERQPVLDELPALVIIRSLAEKKIQPARRVHLHPLGDQRRAKSPAAKRVLEIADRPVDDRHRCRIGSVFLVKFTPFGEQRAVLETPRGRLRRHRNVDGNMRRDVGCGDRLSARRNLIADRNASDADQRRRDEKRF